MKRVAIFASGTGSNAQKIYNYSLKSEHFEVAAILSNRKNAKVLDFAAEHGIESNVFNKQELNSGRVLDYLKSIDIDVVVLAGFLWLIPHDIVEAYSDRMLNIHPALLPKYGGKGMYGHHVHTAVKENKETRSGMTIHLVNEEYDKGKYLLQCSTKLSADDTPQSIGRKVLTLEHRYYPQVVEGICRYL